MARKEKRQFDLSRIQRELNIKQKYIDYCQIPKETLEQIYDDYQFSANRSLIEIKNELLSILNSSLRGRVHSIRGRVKDPDHLIGKIIRNVSERPDKYELIDLDHYNKLITDMIGIRIIILDKRDWREVHESLLKIFHNDPERYISKPKDLITNFDKYSVDSDSEQQESERSYHVEKPVVYITSREDREIYDDPYLEVNDSKTHYRSIHYIIRYKDVYFEIQVRTLFEEGWLEFNHRITYPYDQNNLKKQEYGEILSNLAVAADRLIAFYDDKDFAIDSVNTPPVATGGGCSDRKRNDIEENEEQTLEQKMTNLF